jgi:hypothetical protein
VEEPSEAGTAATWPGLLFLSMSKSRGNTRHFHPTPSYIILNDPGTSIQNLRVRPIQPASEAVAERSGTNEQHIEVRKLGNLKMDSLPCTPGRTEDCSRLTAFMSPCRQSSHISRVSSKFSQDSPLKFSLTYGSEPPGQVQVGRLLRKCVFDIELTRDTCNTSNVFVPRFKGLALMRQRGGCVLPILFNYMTLELSVQ